MSLISLIKTLNASLFFISLMIFYRTNTAKHCQIYFCLVLLVYLAILFFSSLLGHVLLFVPIWPESSCPFQTHNGLLGEYFVQPSRRTSDKPGKIHYGQKCWDIPLNKGIQVFQSDPLPQVYKIKHLAMQSAFTNICGEGKSF